MPAVWFLDVDGVVNSAGEPKVKHGLYNRVTLRARGADGEEGFYPIWYSEDVVKRINAMSRSGLVKVVWLTTWSDQAASVFAPAVGLDDFEVLLDPERPDLARHPFSRIQMWWKHALVNEWLGLHPEYEVVVWTDDDLPHEVKIRVSHKFSECEFMMITPMSKPGLTSETLDRIEDFLKFYEGY